MRLVRGDVVHEFLGHLKTNWAHFLKEHGYKEHLSQILALIQNVEPACAVWHKNVDQFTTSCLAFEQFATSPSDERSTAACLTVPASFSLATTLCSK